MLMPEPVSVFLVLLWSSSVRRVLLVLGSVRMQQLCLHLAASISLVKHLVWPEVSAVPVIYRGCRACVVMEVLARQKVAIENPS